MIRVGTCGWSYAHWAGRWYPAGLPAAARLSDYASRLGSVEIDATFYRLPTARAVRRWRDQTPVGFVFAVKASRTITHLRKLRAPKRSLARFFGRMRALGSKLGPILFQLPPRWRCDPARLEAFLDALPRGQRCAFEFRDPTWFDERVYALLAARNAAFCVYDLGGCVAPAPLTADFVYLRLHGPGEPYAGNYSEARLREWAKMLRNWARGGRDVYCYFDNDENAYAARNALRLNRLLARGR